MRWDKIAPTICVAALWTSACADTGQDHTSVPLYVAGVDMSEPFVAASNVLVSIDRADMAFGPLYLCAGTTAGDLCETARLEWLETVVIDTTTSVPTLAGELSGVTGTVLSWMYDLGISSQLTRSEPYVLEAARTLGDTSFVLEGRAMVDGIEVPFTASVPIQQTEDTELGVPVVRKSNSESFFRDVQSGESGLLVRFDPKAWVSGIDFTPYVGRETCTDEGPTTVCDGALERACDGAIERSTRDCAALGEVCVATQGCVRRLVIQEQTEAFRVLRNSLLSGERPSFNWDYVP